MNIRAGHLNPHIEVVHLNVERLHAVQPLGAVHVPLYEGNDVLSNKGSKAR